MKKIEFVSRITVNGEKKEISREEARDIIIKSQDKALEAMSYERKEAGYLPFWMWDGAGDQIAGAVALVMIILLQRRWKNWTS